MTVFTPNGGFVASLLITELRYYTACAASTTGLQPQANVVVDRSIGGISIGMTEADVTKLYGEPSSTLTVTLGGGLTGHSVRYTIDGAPFLITYDSHGRVVSVETYSKLFFTARGIGPGSSIQLAAALHGFFHDPCELGYWNGTAKTPPSHYVTVFTPNGGLVASVMITQLRLYTDCDNGSHELPPTK